MENMNRIPIAIAECEDDSWTQLHARLLYAASTLHTLEGKLTTKVTEVVKEITVPSQFKYANQIREFFGGYLSYHTLLCVDVKAEFNFVRITLPDFVEQELVSHLSDVPSAAALAPDKMSDVSMRKLYSPILPTIAEMLQKRGSQYGDFCDRARIVQELKRAIRKGDSWNVMKPNQQEAIEMIVDKISRIVNGNPNYKDSWDDISGYAQLIATELGD
jgi:hypothetical protein